MQKVFIFSHRFLILSVVSLLIFSFSFATNASTVIFSDGFESDFLIWTGNDPKWDTSGGNVHGGAKRGEVKGNTEPGDDVLLKNISTFGYDGIVIEFWYRIKESLEDDDHVYVEWTGDGSNWNILNDFTAITKSDIWVFASYPLPVEADGQFNFAIKFRTHLGAVTSDIFYIDDVAVTASSAQSEPTFIPSLEVTPSPTPMPMSSATPIPLTPTPTPILTLVPTPSSKPLFSPQAIPISSKTPMPIPVVTFPPKPNQESSRVDRDLAIVSRSPEPDQEEESIISETPDSLSASISNFFNNSKFFWLIGTMVLAVVFSLVKFK